MKRTWGLKNDLPARSFSPGRSTNSLLGKRRNTASSRSNGLFVAPMTMTFVSFVVLRPSISCINSVITPRCAIAPPVSRVDIRAPKSASISSKKTTQGESRRASENTARTNFSPSPTYYTEISSRVNAKTKRGFTMSITSDGAIASIRQPASLAKARTTSVLPVPGGPNRRQPVILCSFRIPCWNAVGWRIGSETIVRTESMV